MTTAVGDLLELGNEYLQAERFSLHLGSAAYELGLEMGHEDCSGALVCVGEDDYNEVWVTQYCRPYELASVYERIL